MKKIIVTSLLLSILCVVAEAQDRMRSYRLTPHDTKLAADCIQLQLQLNELEAAEQIATETLNLLNEPDPQLLGLRAAIRRQGILGATQAKPGILNPVDHASADNTH